MPKRKTTRGRGRGGKVISKKKLNENAANENKADIIDDENNANKTDEKVEGSNKNQIDQGDSPVAKDESQVKTSDGNEKDAGIEMISDENDEDKDKEVKESQEDQNVTERVEESEPQPKESVEEGLSSPQKNLPETDSANQNSDLVSGAEENAVKIVPLTTEGEAQEVVEIAESEAAKESNENEAFEEEVEEVYIEEKEIDDDVQYIDEEIEDGEQDLLDVIELDDSEKDVLGKIKDEEKEKKEEIAKEVKTVSGKSVVSSKEDSKSKSELKEYSGDTTFEEISEGSMDPMEQEEVIEAISDNEIMMVETSSRDAEKEKKDKKKKKSSPVQEDETLADIFLVTENEDNQLAVVANDKDNDDISDASLCNDDDGNDLSLEEISDEELDSSKRKKPDISQQDENKPKENDDGVENISKEEESVVEESGEKDLGKKRPNDEEVDSSAKRQKLEETQDTSQENQTNSVENVCGESKENEMKPQAPLPVRSKDDVNSVQTSSTRYVEVSVQTQPCARRGKIVQCSINPIGGGAMKGIKKDTEESTKNSVLDMKRKYKEYLPSSVESIFTDVVSTCPPFKGAYSLSLGPVTIADLENSQFRDICMGAAVKLNLSFNSNIQGVLQAEFAEYTQVSRLIHHLKGLDLGNRYMIMSLVHKTCKESPQIWQALLIFTYNQDNSDLMAWDAKDGKVRSRLSVCGVPEAITKDFVHLVFPEALYISSTVGKESARTLTMGFSSTRTTREICMCYEFLVFNDKKVEITPIDPVVMENENIEESGFIEENGTVIVPDIENEEMLSNSPCEADTSSHPVSETNEQETSQQAEKDTVQAPQSDIVDEIPQSAESNKSVKENVQNAREDCPGEKEKNNTLEDKTKDEEMSVLENVEGTKSEEPESDENVRQEEKVDNENVDEIHSISLATDNNELNNKILSNDLPVGNRHSSEENTQDSKLDENNKGGLETKDPESSTSIVDETEKSRAAERSTVKEVTENIAQSTVSVKKSPTSNEQVKDLCLDGDETGRQSSGDSADLISDGIEQLPQNDDQSQEITDSVRVAVAEEDVGKIDEQGEKHDVEETTTAEVNAGAGNGEDVDNNEDDKTLKSKAGKNVSDKDNSLEDVSDDEMITTEVKDDENNDEGDDDVIILKEEPFKNVIDTIDLTDDDKERMADFHDKEDGKLREDNKDGINVKNEVESLVDEDRLTMTDGDLEIVLESIDIEEETLEYTHVLFPRSGDNREDRQANKYSDHYRRNFYRSLLPTTYNRFPVRSPYHRNPNVAPPRHPPPHRHPLPRYPPQPRQEYRWEPPRTFKRGTPRLAPEFRYDKVYGRSEKELKENHPKKQYEKLSSIHSGSSFEETCGDSSARHGVPSRESTSERRDSSKRDYKRAKSPSPRNNTPVESQDAFPPVFATTNNDKQNAFNFTSTPRTRPSSYREQKSVPSDSHHREAQTSSHFDYKNSRSNSRYEPSSSRQREEYRSQKPPTHQQSQHSKSRSFSPLSPMSASSAELLLRTSPQKSKTSTTVRKISHSPISASSHSLSPVSRSPSPQPRPSRSSRYKVSSPPRSHRDRYPVSSRDHESDRMASTQRRSRSPSPYKSWERRRSRSPVYRRRPSSPGSNRRPSSPGSNRRPSSPVSNRRPSSPVSSREKMMEKKSVASQSRSSDSRRINPDKSSKSDNKINTLFVNDNSIYKKIAGTKGSTLKQSESSNNSKSFNSQQGSGFSNLPPTTSASYTISPAVTVTVPTASYSVPANYLPTPPQPPTAMFYSSSSIPQSYQYNLGMNAFPTAAGYSTGPVSPGMYPSSYMQPSSIQPQHQEPQSHLTSSSVYSYIHTQTAMANVPVSQSASHSQPGHGSSYSTALSGAGGGGGGGMHKGNQPSSVYSQQSATASNTKQWSMGDSGNTLMFQRILSKNKK